MTKGFILGKFMPLHRGHCHLIQTAVDTCNEVTVLVCSLPTEPIDGNIRYEWVKKAFPTVNVIHFKEVVPQEPLEHPQFWDIWTDIVKRHHPEKIDFVFSSEDYGYQLAECVGAKHILVDKERRIYPVSGTLVRNNTLEVWGYIPNHVKPYFVKRILIHGGESCGKSTLTSQLANHFGTIGVQEFAREWIENNNNEFNYNDLILFAEEQHKQIEEGVQIANKLIFADTDSMTTKIYSEEYFGKVHPIVELLSEKPNWDLVLLLKPTIPYKEEIQRNFGHKREYMHERFRNILIEKGLRFVEIDKVGDERYKQSIEAIENFFDFKN